MTSCNLVDGYQSFKNVWPCVLGHVKTVCTYQTAQCCNSETDNLHDTAVFQLYLVAFTCGKIRYFFQPRLYIIHVQHSLKYESSRVVVPFNLTFSILHTDLILLCSLSIHVFSYITKLSS